jgi:periplasmic glucans biosynthesis protein
LASAGAAAALLPPAPALTQQPPAPPGSPPPPPQGADVPAWPPSAPLGPPEPFSFERLIEQARALAREPFAPGPQAAEWLARLTPEQQRAVRVRPERAVQLGPTPFQLRPVHLGGFHREPVRVHLVQGGTARELLYDPAMFELGDVRPPEPPDATAGFAGLRIFFPLNPGGAYEEVLAFLGASYFRAVGQGTRFGVSARGLALETGLGKPEEFPVFTRFWVFLPPGQLDPLTVCALLEGPSVAGAYRFVVAPREATAAQVDASLFFRGDVEQAGVAPLTSMFFFAPNDRVGVDDHRHRVHTSDGLSVWRGGGEVLWRPLVAPAEPRVSVFGDENPRGFGLLQRERDLALYGDVEARFDLRPNLWVEPKGAWGRGSVRLIEVPTRDETRDNIVAFWTPEEPVRAGAELRLAYGLSWSLAPPLQTGLAPVLGTSIGQGGRPGDPERPPDVRRVAIDFAQPFGEGGAGAPAPEVALDCGAEGGCTPPVLLPNPATGGWRVMFDARLRGGEAVELRCLLTQGGRPVSETWLYRLDRS